MSYHGLGGELSQAGSVAAGGYCTAQFGPATTGICAAIGAEIGKFIETTMGSLMASTDVTGPESVDVQSQAMRAVWAARLALRDQLHFAIKQLAVAAKVTPAQAAAALGKYVRIGRMTRLGTSTADRGTVCSVDRCLEIKCVPEPCRATGDPYRPGTAGCGPCYADWWEPGDTLNVDAITSGKHPYVAMSDAHSPILMLNQSGDRWYLNVAAFQAGMAAISAYAYNLVVPGGALENATLDLAITSKPMVVTTRFTEILTKKEDEGGSGTTWLLLGAAGLGAWWWLKKKKR